jgi:hypothetical protein
MLLTYRQARPEHRDVRVCALRIANPVRGIKLLALAEKGKARTGHGRSRPWPTYASSQVRLEEELPTFGPSLQLPVSASRLVLIIHFSRE